MATNTPGRPYRKGLTRAEFFRKFPDDATAEALFAEMRWPNGPRCPHCNSDRVQSGAAHKTMPYRCRDCRKRFSVRTGTDMADYKLGYQTWALATYLLTTGIKGTSSLKLPAQHLDRYVGEFEGRHERGPLDTVDKMATMARGMLGSIWPTGC